jgi:L-amino acid N-acyltransferase YncA
VEQDTLSILIRHLDPAEPGDLSQVSAIFAWYAVNSLATFEESPRSEHHWSELCDLLSSRSLPFLVAEDDGQIAGYAYAGPWRTKPAYRHTVEDSVFISPDRTGLGIGKRLLTRLLAESANAGVRQMIAVIAEADSGASIALHMACGFTEAGRLADVGYKHGRWISTVLMQRAVSN